MKRLSAATILAARERALAQIAGTLVTPPPVQVRGRSRFCTPIRKREPAEKRIALRTKGGGKT